MFPTPFYTGPVTGLTLSWIKLSTALDTKILTPVAYILTWGWGETINSWTIEIQSRSFLLLSSNQALPMPRLICHSPAEGHFGYLQFGMKINESIGMFTLISMNIGECRFSLHLNECSEAGLMGHMVSVRFT